MAANCIPIIRWAHLTRLKCDYAFCFPVQTIKPRTNPTSQTNKHIIICLEAPSLFLAFYDEEQTVLSKLTHDYSQIQKLLTAIWTFLQFNRPETVLCHLSCSPYANLSIVPLWPTPLRKKHCSLQMLLLLLNSSTKTTTMENASCSFVFDAMSHYLDVFLFSGLKHHYVLHSVYFHKW